MCLEEGYSSGVWLREDPDVMKTNLTARVPYGTIMIVIDLDEDSIKVVSSDGKSGWTFDNRLVKLEVLKA